MQELAAFHCIAGTIDAGTVEQPCRFAHGTVKNTETILKQVSLHLIYSFLSYKFAF